jgi:hypothetical protein
MGRLTRDEKIAQVKAKLKKRHEAEDRKNGKKNVATKGKPTFSHIEPGLYTRPPQQGSVATFEPCKEIDVFEAPLSSSEAYKKAREQPSYIMDVVDGPIKRRNREAKRLDNRVKAIEADLFLTKKERLKLMKEITNEREALVELKDQESHYGSVAWVKSARKHVNSLLELQAPEPEQVYKSERPFVTPDPADRVPLEYQGQANVREADRLDRKELDRKNKWLVMHGDGDASSSSVGKFFKRSYNKSDDPKAGEEDIAPSILRRYQRERIFEMISDENTELQGLDQGLLAVFRQKVGADGDEFIDDDDDDIIEGTLVPQKPNSRFFLTLFQRRSQDAKNPTMKGGLSGFSKAAKNMKKMPPRLQEKHRFEFWKAVATGDLEVMEKLLGMGFDVHDTNGSQRNAVHIAVEGESDTALQFLLDKTDIQVEVYDEDGRTPIHLAILLGNLSTLLTLLTHTPASAKFKNQEGLLPIHLTAIEGDVAAAKLLVQCYSNIDVRCYRGMAPLHYAAVRGKMAMARFLLTCGANKMCRNIEEDPMTPLDLALRYKRLQMAELLRCYKGWTPPPPSPPPVIHATVPLLFSPRVSVQVSYHQPSLSIRYASGQHAAGKGKL